jgi:nuclear mRNA export protein SAC3
MNKPQRHFEGQLQSSSSQASARAPFSTASSPFNTSKNKLATEIDTLLRKNGIVAPSWPTSAPGDPSQKTAVEAFWQNTKAYRARVRTCLIRNGYLDDPDKPKKLSEAIDFKGTCEDMCPEFEKATRIVEHDVQSAEKELSPDAQSYWPAPHKMVKALARSAAGQDAPLPEDVRSPAALRRTLDYLIDTVLDTNDLPAIHGFLWDRTRAIRRDFVFQQSSITSQELLDQVYCLEQITRFHVVALHQMSHEDVVAEDFSEQQEVEQLGKALLSLIHAYEDCMAQGIHCENESEFRAYYVLFNSHNTGILEAVQDWGWKYWGESDDIRTAVSLVETLQNIWDTHGPLKPHSATDIAQNAYHRFFSIIEDTKVSYTMACFAEIHFNKVRKAALKTILASYRKQRDQTTDWTLERLNTYLHFDDENDIMKFGEAYGVHFDILNGQECLSFESDDLMKDPFPQLKQPHSYRLVELKRGDHTLPEVIHHTVYEETTEETTEEDDGNSLFVPPSSPSAVREQPTRSRSPDPDAFPDPLNDPLIDDTPFPAPDTSKQLIQKEQTDMQARKSQNNSRVQAVSSSSFGTFTPTTDSRAGNFTTFGEKASGSGGSKPAGNTSIFENKSYVPQQGIFSFLDQRKSGLPSQLSSSSTPFFPPIAVPPATEISKPSVPLMSKPFSSSLGSSGSFPLSQVLTSPPASTTNTKQLESVSPKSVESEEVNGNLEGSKYQSLDRLSSNHLASLGNQAPVINTPKTKKSRMAAFSQWVALGQDGLIDQFTELTVETILMQTVKKYVANEKKRRLQEEERHSREAAAHFRFKFLATKYFYAWRDIAHRLWMRRKGRLARQARRQMAEESFRASRASEKRDVVEDFKASGGAKRQNTEQSLIPVVDRSPSHAVTKHTPRGPKNGNGLTKSESPKPPRQKQNSADDMFRKSLLSDYAYLQGGSRIHLIPNYKPSMESRRQPNGVKTDYFRLKARGIMTLPDGTPLASTAAVHLNHKRSLDNINKSLTPERTISKPSASSVPSKSVTNDSLLFGTSAERDNDFEALKARPRAVMAKDQEEKQNKKRLLDDDEVELFASAKRVRDQMDEETLWMRTEIQKSMSRSSS